MVSKHRILWFFCLWGAAILSIVFFPASARASYQPLNTSVNQNIGIGTTTPLGALIVSSGNVGIGTWTTAGGSLIVRGGANVGIGSAWPGVRLDVNGAGRFLGAGDSYLNVGGGNVGIATTTPQGGLVVLNGNVGIGTFAPRAALVVQSGNVGIGTANANYKLQIGGCTSALGSNSCVDVAELIPSSDAVESGDVVMLDARATVTVMKAVSQSNDLLFGVVTTDPAIVIEGSSVGIINGKGYEPQPRKPAVALVGRVPVKASLENGPISIGDMIASSSTPGVGSKAVKAGRVIGMALEALTEVRSPVYEKIIVYVNPHWWDGAKPDDGPLRDSLKELSAQVQELKIQNKGFEEEIRGVRYMVEQMREELLKKDGRP